MPVNHPATGILVLIAASLLCMVLGSVHAFSVFLEPLEHRFEAPRALISLTYSFALVTLTFSVLIGYKVYARTSPVRFVALVGIIGSAGALAAAYAPSLLLLWLGYGALFGGANGLGYGFSLQLAAQANPGREGWAMGLVTASYALGATIAPPILSFGLHIGGTVTALVGLALVLAIVAPVSALLLHRAGVTYQQVPHSECDQVNSGRRTVFLFWLSYGTAVAAGLMTIGHATGIARLGGWSDVLWIAPMAIAVSNLIGSFCGGTLVDRTAPDRLLVALPLVSSVALIVIAGKASGWVMLGALASIGFAYGAVIAAYPAVIAKLFHKSDSTKFYGRVFTAWGTAGLVAPWLAGTLFDRTGTYTFALSVAAALGCVSAACAWILFRSRNVRL